MTDWSSADDRVLLCSARQTPDAFAAFYRRHIDYVIAYAARHVDNPSDIADLAATTFLRVLESADRFDADSGEARAWLTGIAKNVIANGRRRRDRERSAIARIDAQALLGPADVDWLEAQIDASRAASLTTEALDALAPQHAETLRLVASGDRSSAEYASQLGIKPEAFRVRLLRARRELRAVVERLESRRRDQHTQALGARPKEIGG